MRRTTPNPEQQQRDEQLLDLLSMGETPEQPEQVDGIVAALAELRRDVAADLPTGALDLDAVAPALTGSRWSRWRGRLVASGAAVVLAGGGGAVAVAAGNAGPDSPLWPITQLIHPERADSRVAESQADQLLAAARAAAVDHRYDEAERLLDEAEPLLARVLSPVERQRLQDEVGQVRGLVESLASDVDEVEVPLPDLTDETGDLERLPALPGDSGPTDGTTPAPEPTEPAEDDEDEGGLPLPPLPPILP